MGEESTERRARARRTVYPVQCVECGCASAFRWSGWRAYRTDDLRLREPPALAFFCPRCAEREFDFGAD
jgi:predicted RNA-binding Zn-ribbon protein involved in translation (DUF1610 family)